MTHKPQPHKSDNIQNAKKLNELPKKVYFFRLIGMGLGGLPVIFVIFENNSPLISLAWILLSCYIWPHLAYLRTKKHKQPFQAEQTNLLIDSFIAGTSVALIHFNLLPAALLIAIATADKVNSGIPRLWIKGVCLTLLGIVLCGFFTGFAFQPNTSMNVIMASLPVAVIHTLLVSMYSYKLIIRLQSQNKKLNHLSQTDSLTGIYNRRHWQKLTTELIKQNQNKAIDATLLMIDIDHFKQVNDRFGHIAGDDVLCEVTRQLIKLSGEDAIIGRLGGDEFAVVVKLPISKAKELAEQITKVVKQIKIHQAEHLSCSSSIGMAEISHAKGNIRNWIDVADNMLYKAKSSGRNCFTY